MTSDLFRLSSLSLIALGSFAMLYSIIKYCRILSALKEQAYDENIFSGTIYTACLLMMLFFLAGYVLVFITFITTPTFPFYQGLISAIFFFGSLFVLSMVALQKRMWRVISKKSSEMISILVNAIEARDNYTKGHSAHVLAISRLIYEHMDSRIKNKVNLDILLDAAILHDIGKIGIPDTVLNKPDKLDNEEMHLIRQHPDIGSKIFQNSSFGGIARIIYCHHERPDHNGYYHILFEDVPLESKIISVADTFSAIYTDRTYRKGKSYEEAVDILNEVSGKQLDPYVVKIFCRIKKSEIESLGIPKNPSCEL